MHENPPANSLQPPAPTYIKTDPLRRFVLVAFALASWALAYEVSQFDTAGAATVAQTFVLAGLILLLAPAKRPTNSGFLGLIEAVKGIGSGRN